MFILRKHTLFCVMLAILLIAGCNGGSTVTPVEDKAPPEWDAIVGIQTVTPGDKTVTVTWGLANDILSPPVVYLLYIDTDNNPFDTTPTETQTVSPYTFSGLLNNQQYWCGVRCKDSATPANIDSNDNVLSAIPEIDMWVRVWGGDSDEGATRMVVSNSDDLYIAGFYSGTVDFNPDSPIEERTSYGNRSTDVFLAKYNKYGEFQWVQTWGGIREDRPHDIAMDSLGNIYVCGMFAKWVDFDPGTGIDGQEAIGVDNNAAFLSKFDSNGNYIWARTWANEDYAEAYTMAIDGLNNIYVGGFFAGSVDFDPSANLWEIDSLGDVDIFLSKFDADGNFVDLNTWTGEMHQFLRDVEVDQSNNIYLYGSYYGTMDLNPLIDEEIVGTLQDSRTDIFLIKMKPFQEFYWGKTLGGDSRSDYGKDIAIDNSGNIYATGGFCDSVDFDPNAGVAILTAYPGGYPDAFLAKYDPSGNFLWAKSWGADDWDIGASIVVNDDNSCLVAGRFRETVDFDPGVGISELTPVAWDIFVSHFSDVGDFISVGQCGGKDSNICDSTEMAIVRDSDGSYYLSSEFQSSIIEGLDLKIGSEIEMYISDEYSCDAFISKFELY